MKAKYYIEYDYYPEPKGGMDSIEGPFNSIDEAKAKYDVTESGRILEVRDNLITPVLNHIYKDSWSLVMPSCSFMPIEEVSNKDK